MDVTIVIPTKNGGDRFIQVLEAIQRQKTQYSYEVVVVDSGSTDATVSHARRYGCLVRQIPPNEFGHGRTRNLGASLGTGTYILFMTQDACPANEEWLGNLISAVESDERIAGGFSRHIPYPECNLPDQQMLRDLFDGFLKEDPYHGTSRTRSGNIIFQLTDDNRTHFEEESGYRQFLAFSSDNSAVVRRTVFEKIPYGDVDFAEDQLWAETVMEAGYRRVYVPDSVICHSHNYPLQAYAKRYYEDYKAVYKLYGTNPVPTLLDYWHRVLGDTHYQWKYIHAAGQDMLSTSGHGKIYWYTYAFRRNMIRYRAARQAIRDIQQRIEQ